MAHAIIVCIQDQQITRRAQSCDPAVPTRSETPVFGVEQRDLGEPLPNELRSAVLRAVIDNDGVVSAHAVQAALDERKPVERDDDHPDFSRHARLADSGQRLPLQDLPAQILGSIPPTGGVAAVLQEKA